MAQTVNEFVDSLVANVPEYRPTPYYEADGDSVIFYARREPSHELRLNSLLTLFLSMHDDSLVGCEVKGVRRMLETGRSLGVVVQDHKIRLSILLFAAINAPPETDNVAVDRYRGELARVAKDVEVELPAGSLSA